MTTNGVEEIAAVEACCTHSASLSPAKLLGHSSVEITYNRYIHFFEGDIDDTIRQTVGA